MTSKEFELLVNEVMGRLMEISPLYSTEILSKYMEDCMQKWEANPTSGRVTLLKYVLQAAKSCEACPRHSHRLGFSSPEGTFDSIMIIGDYPTYLDSMTERVFSGAGSTLSSKCGTCAKLEEHVGCFIEGSAVPKIKPSEMKCEYTPVEIKGKVQLPMVFSNGTSSLMPFVTPGQVLDRMLIDLDLGRSSWGVRPKVFITNTLLCPSLDEEGLAQPVTAAERRACKPWLELQLKIVRPKLVICMGKEAFGYFFPKEKLTENVGKLRNLSTEPFLVGTTYHPGMVIRSMESGKSDMYYKEISSNLEFYVGKYKEMCDE